MASSLKWRTGGEPVNFDDSMVKQQQKITTIVKQDIKNSNLIVNNLKFIRKPLKELTEDTKLWYFQHITEKAIYGPLSTKSLQEKIKNIANDNLCFYSIKPIDTYKFKTKDSYEYIALTELNQQFSKNNPDYLLSENEEVTSLLRAADRSIYDKLDQMRDKIYKIENLYEKNREKFAEYFANDMDFILYGAKKPTFFNDNHETQDDLLNDNIVDWTNMPSEINIIHDSSIIKDDIGIFNTKESKNDKTDVDDDNWMRVNGNKKKAVQKKDTKEEKNKKPILLNTEGANFNKQIEEIKKNANNSNKVNTNEPDFSILNQLNPKTKVKSVKEEKVDEEAKYATNKPIKPIQDEETGFVEVKKKKSKK